MQRMMNVCNFVRRMVCARTGDSNVMQMGRRNKVMTYVLTRHIHVQRCGLLYSKFLVGGGEVDGDAGNVMLQSTNAGSKIMPESDAKLAITSTGVAT